MTGLDSPERPTLRLGEGQLEAGILGPFEVTGAAGRIEIRGATERALLARLALDGNRPVSNDRIVAALWGEQAPRRPKQAIHALVFRLRKALGEAAPALRTGAHGYSLALVPGGLDLWRFEALAARARRDRSAGDPDGAAAGLAAALALWRGDPLAGVGDYPFVAARARRLEEARFGLLTERIEADLARGRHVHLIPELEALALERPTHEGVCRLAMIALYRSGRQVDSLATYDAFRKRLAGQFGIDPSPPLAALELEVLRQDPKLDWHEPAAQADPAPRSVLHHERAQGSLPHPLTSFVGREGELAEVVALVARHRLVTVAGPGGGGKTRLAIEAGHQLAARGEVCFTRLEGAGGGDLVAEAMAGALGVRLGSGPTAAAGLAAALADRDVLVVLDNCEHLLQPCADLVLAVLEAAPDVRFLLTSREQLGVPGEAVYRLPSLPAPEPGGPAEAIGSAGAVRLFLDRAAAALGSPDPVPAADLPTVAEVCRRLDGIPLAIELAAARLTVLSLDQLAQRLADRFTVLDAGSRTAMPRHRTLLAAMTWSHDLLDEQERGLFRRLAVFASAFPPEAAETVCAGGVVPAGQVWDLLARLAAKSLVTIERDGGEAGYRLLNTVREYAASWLSDEAERAGLARRHHGWCLELATGAAAALHHGDLVTWARRVQSGRDDIRAALDWALGTGGAGVTLAARMWPVWEMRGQDREGREWIRRALARAPGEFTAEYATLLLGAGVFARAADDFGEARRYLDQATAAYRELGDAAGGAHCCLELGRLFVLESKLAEADQYAARARRLHADLADEWGVAWSDVLAGNVAMVRGDYQSAARMLGMALAAGRHLGNPLLVGETLVFLGLVAMRSGQVGQAAGHFGEALEIGRTLDSDALVNVALANLGVVAGREGDHARALTLLDEALAMARKRGEPLAVARILLESGEVASRRGEHFRGQVLAADALRVYRRIGTSSPVPQCLDVLARASLSLGQIPRAAALLAAAGEARRDLGLAAPAAGSTAPAGAQRGTQEWQRAWRWGASLSRAQAIRFALDEAAPPGAQGQHA